jgi:hypothetical protein
MNLEYKIENLINEAFINFSHSPYKLREEIKKARKALASRDKILGSIKELEKRIELLKDKDPAKERKLKKDLQKQISNMESTNYTEYGLVDKDVLQKILNVKKLKEIGTGYTSIIFNDPIKKGNILGFTLDDSKIKWMQANKEIFNFQLIDTIPYSTGNQLFIYTAEKLKKTMSNGKMSKRHQEIIYDDVITKYYYLKNRQGFYNVTIKDMDFILKGVEDRELKDILEKLEKTFSNDEVLDLHQGQWGETQKGKIILFDPIISKRAMNPTEDFNKLDLKTEFVFMLEKIFSDTDSSYLKKIKKFLQKK